MFQRLFAICLCVLLSACANNRLQLSENENKLIDQQLVENEKNNATLLAEYTQRLSNYDETELTFYAPLALFEAKSLKDQVNDSSESTSDKLTLLKALFFLDKAIQNKSAVKLHLKRADTQFSELQRLKADLTLPTEFQKIHQAYQELIILIESGKVKEAISEQDVLISSMTKLEIKAINQGFFAEAYAYINQAKAKGADSYAKQTLDELEIDLIKAQELIKKSFRDKHAIDSTSQEINQKAHKLLTITEQIYSVHHADAAETEARFIEQYELISGLSELLDITQAGKPLSINEYLTRLSEQQSKLKELESLKAIQLKNIETLEEHIKLLKNQSYSFEKSNSNSVVSPETNKAVLTELLLPGQYNEAEPSQVSSEIEVLE